MATKRRGTPVQPPNTSVKKRSEDLKDSSIKSSPKRARTVPVSGEEDLRLQGVNEWKLWGPYLSERQWGTVREDYSSDASCWTYFPHDHAVFRAYQWGEDGLFALSDSSAKLCLGLALWNGKDKILKERLFGLSGPQGNHGEDVKELYYYLDSTPSHSYMQALYKYPQSEFPYEDLIEENKSRTRLQEEYEILDTGVFEEGYWDVEVTVAKQSPKDIRVRYSVTNQGAAKATIRIIPQLWFRNTWSWDNDENEEKPTIAKLAANSARCSHTELGEYEFSVNVVGGSEKITALFTENETNLLRLQGGKTSSNHAKDALHLYVVDGKKSAVNEDSGTKCGMLVTLDVAAGQSRQIEVRLVSSNEKPLSKVATKDVVALRKHEADQFYQHFSLTTPEGLTAEQVNVARQACAGLLWSKQIFIFHLNKWISESAYPNNKINQRWKHLKNEDIISMPDKWEFPWYAPWDLAFHMIPFVHLDPEFAKRNMLIMLSERYMHPNGQLPGCEFDFDDPNPPLHAWACWDIYEHVKAKDMKDTTFLKQCFQRLSVNFSWWMNQKALSHNPYMFAGGFLGLDNISCVNRSFLPDGVTMAQVDGTAWMAFFSVYMLRMALELALEDETYQDIALRYLTHYVRMVDALQELWSEEEGLFYDHLYYKKETHILKINTLVSLVPLVAVMNIEESTLNELPEFSKALSELMAERQGCTAGIIKTSSGDILLSAVSTSQLCRILTYMFNPEEFLSEYGIRSVSKIHEKNPFVLTLGKTEHEIHYAPGESDSEMFGGNSNWRGPVWICMNYILYAGLKVFASSLEPAVTAKLSILNMKSVTLEKLANEICDRVSNMFLPNKDGVRAVHGKYLEYTKDSWSPLVLFYEYYHGDSGRGCGASHQTGWSALVACMLQRN